MKKWEYKVLVRKHDELLSDEQLNEIGAQGFELFNVCAMTIEETFVGRTDTVNVVRYFFKRPV